MSDLTDFLLARIGEDEAYVAEGTLSVPSSTPASGVRLLRDAAAKRRIVEEVADTFDLNRPPSPTNSEAVWLGEAVLKILASVYADHPDYREEWKP